MATIHGSDRFDHVPARGLLLPCAVGLVMLCAAASAQPVTWEVMPGVRRLPSDPDKIVALDFLRGEGAQADDPSADTLVVFSFNGGAFLYNPSGAAGAAGDNGEWGAWHLLCSISSCTSPDDGLITAAGTFVMGSQSGPTGIARGTDRGRTWVLRVDGYNAAPFIEPRLPGLVGPDGTPTILAGTTSFIGGTFRSDGDGAPGTWTGSGLAGGSIEALGVVPPSAMLPTGRILAGVWNGVTYSDDGGQTYTPSSAYGQAAYIAYSFTFVPDDGHPYGGVAFAGLENVGLYPAARAEIHRSDDGGATWALVHRFTAAELEIPVPEGTDVSQVTLYATADGTVWAGVGQSTGASNPARSTILRSVDGGHTWVQADAGYRNVHGWGYRVNQFRLSRTGVLYAATDRGVWRTTAAVVVGEAPPSSLGLSLSVSPNPSRGLITLSLTSRETQRVRVVVTDVTGREVAAVEAWATPEGSSVSVDASRWASGVYVARASVGRHTEHVTARFTVAR